MNVTGHSATKRRLIPLAFLLGACFALDVAQAKQPVVTLGDVETLPDAQALRPLLRAALEEELSTADFGKVSFRKRYVLDASLVKLESASGGKITTSTCVVSAMLRTKDKQVVAVIRGRATAEGSRGSTEQTKTDAIRGAARSAVKKVPPALRDTEGST